MNARLLSWAISNTLFALALYYGFSAGVTSLQYLATTLIWFGLFVGLLSLSATARTALIGKKPPAPSTIDLLFDAAVVAFLILHNHPVLATAYCLHTLMLHSAYAAANRPKPEPSP